MFFSAGERDQELCRIIVEAADYIRRYIDGLDERSFLLDSKTQDAVAMRLQQILESAAKISSAGKDDLKINWSSLIAMRNKISHSYADIDARIVWGVVTELEELKNLVIWARQKI